jgi:hypothetical protein
MTKCLPKCRKHIIVYLLLWLIFLIFISSPCIQISFINYLMLHMVSCRSSVLCYNHKCICMCLPSVMQNSSQNCRTVCLFLIQNLHYKLGNQWQWMKFMLCCVYVLMEDVGPCFNCFEDKHTKLNYRSNGNHIFMFCRYYRTFLQNFNKILLKSWKLHILQSKHSFTVNLHPQLLHSHLLTHSLTPRNRILIVKITLTLSIKTNYNLLVPRKPQGLAWTDELM